MTEQELKNPSGFENKSSQEITQKDLFDKIEELQKLEENLFNGEGRLGKRVSKNETQIDKKYDEKNIDEIKDLKTKIKLIQELIDYFSSENQLNDMLTKNNNSYKKYGVESMTLKIKKNMDIFLKKYPEYKSSIFIFLSEFLENNNYLIDFYKNEKNSNEIINKILKENQSQIQERFKWLEKCIKLIQKTSSVKNKTIFLNLFLNELKIGKISSLEIEKNFENLDKINNLNYFKNIGEITQCRCLLVDINNLIEIDAIQTKISKNPNNKENKREFINTINNSKNKLELIKIGDIEKDYSFYQQELLKIKINNIDNDQLITPLAIITDKNSYNLLKELLENVLGSDSNSGYNSLKNFYNSKFIQLLSNDNISYQDKNNIRFLAYNIVTEFENRNFNSNFNNDLITELRNISTDYLNLLIKESSNKYEKIINIIDKDPKYKYIKDDIKNFNKNNKNNDKNEFNVKAYIIDTYYNELIKGEKNEKPDNKLEKQISKEKKQEMQQKIDNLGLNAKVTDEGKIVGKNGEETFSQKIGNKSQIEINANGELILLNSLGYEMKYENNDIGLEKSLETSETFDYLNRIGLGYFGNNFKSMLETMYKYLPNQTGYLSINQQDGNFLSMRELNEIIIPIFKNVGFIDNSQNLDYLAPEEVTDTVMSYRLSKINGGESFIKGKPFNKIIFGELLQDTNKV